MANKKPGRMTPVFYCRINELVDSGLFYPRAKFAMLRNLRPTG